MNNPHEKHETAIVKALREQLRPFHSKVILRLLIDDHSVEEISRTLGIPAEHIQRDLDQITGALTGSTCATPKKKLRALAEYQPLPERPPETPEL